MILGQNRMEIWEWQRPQLVGENRIEEKYLACQNIQKYQIH